MALKGMHPSRPLGNAECIHSMEETAQRRLAPQKRAPREKIVTDCSQGELTFEPWQFAVFTKCQFRLEPKPPPETSKENLRFPLTSTYHGCSLIFLSCAMRTRTLDDLSLSTRYAQ